MKKFRNITGRSEKDVKWAEDIRAGYVKFLRTVMGGDHSMENRELAHQALLAIPYLKNTASHWIDDLNKPADKKGVVVRIAEYAGFLANSPGFIDNVLKALEAEGLEKEYSDAIRSLRGSTTIFYADGDVDLARAIAKGILDQRETDSRKETQTTEVTG